MADDKDNFWWQKGVTVFARLSAWIVGPVIVGVFLGKWLDQKFKTEPILFIVTVGLAFFLSMFGLIKETAKEFKNLETAAKKDKDSAK